jgi:predicted short-subunit dehydrogenase-like oxidoreductase (DUF2520 family)
MDLAIVGAGRVGTSLAVLWQRAGHRIVAVAGGPATPERVGRFLPGVPVLEAVEAATGAEIVVIATPDAVIATVCSEMAEAGALGSASAVVHASGATGLDALAAAASAGAHVGGDVDRPAIIQKSNAPAIAARARPLTTHITRSRALR